MKKNYNILISFDNNYVDQAIKMLYSLFNCNKDVFFNVYIFYINLSKESINELNSFFEKNVNCKPIFYKTDLCKDRFPVYLDHTSIETYTRLYVPFFLKEKIDKILWLDCDIICNGDIKKLYETNLNNYYVAASENKGPIGSEEFNEVMNNNLGLPADNKYINAGVLLINVEKIKKDFSIEKINNFIDDNKDNLIMQDQDIINKMFYKKIKLVPSIYNYQINAYHEDEIDDNGVLIHYSDSVKPWYDNYNSIKKAKFYYDILEKMDKKEELNSLKKMHKKNNKQSVDIIIPIYNSKKTLERALKSIEKQVNNEIIKTYIIDDCSTEDYSKIIDKYRDKIKIIYKKLSKNGGPGTARNHGLSISKGKYIIFLDSDDCFSSNDSVKKLLYKINTTNADETRSIFRRVNSNSSFDFKDDNLGVHGKIYRRYFIEQNNIKFSETRSFEDTYFNALIYLNDGFINDIYELTYLWNDNDCSLSYTEDEVSKLKDYSLNIYKAITSNSDKDKGKITTILVDTLYFIYCKCKDDEDLYEQINDYIDKLVSLNDEYDLNIYDYIEKYYDDIDDFCLFLNKQDNNYINTFNLSDLDKKRNYLKNHLSEFGEDNYIETPINTNCGGKNLHIGSGVYINFGLSLVDNGNIYIEDNVFIGPNVNILTLNHGVSLKARQDGVVEIKDVRICENVWIGANATILPGVTIGKNSVIGAGSVVTKNIPSDSLAVGNPCKVIKKL